MRLMNKALYTTYGHCLLNIISVITGDLLSAINRDFGSYDNMREKLSAASIGIQGSGWGWLGYNKTTRTLAITTCANQDPLEATTGKIYQKILPNKILLSKNKKNTSHVRHVLYLAGNLFQ